MNAAYCASGEISTRPSASVDQFPNRSRALEPGRPLRSDGLFLLPLSSGGQVRGLIEVEGASDGEIASGGMQPWHALASVVAASLENAEQFERLQQTESRFRSLVEQMPAVTYLDTRR